MKMSELQNIIENMSPLELQESWDNSGMQVLTCDRDINRILVAMEVTSKVIDEASGYGADVIITHHPLIFDRLNKVDCNDITGNLIIKLIKANINVYSSHTPFDKCSGGNNDYLARLMHLTDVKKMEEDDSGYCRVGFVDGECSVSEFADQLCRWLKLDKGKLSFSGDPDSRAYKVGLCTGAGSDFIFAAKKAGCDLFVTGDVKYHAAQNAKERGLNLLDIGHYGSERLFAENMASYLRKHITSAEIIISQEDINPFDTI